jgi:hypothetical protein
MYIFIVLHTYSISSVEIKFPRLKIKQWRIEETKSSFHVHVDSSSLPTKSDIWRIFCPHMYSNMANGFALQRVREDITGLSHWNIKTRRVSPDLYFNTYT